VEAINFHETSGEPRDETQGVGIKISRDIGLLLTMSTRRDAVLSHEPGTIEKARIMMLSTILPGCGLDDVVTFSENIQLILWQYTKWIDDAANKGDLIP
jgi:hypothetical protein